MNRTKRLGLTDAERQWVSDQKIAMVRDSKRMAESAKASGVQLSAEAYKSWGSYRMICLIERLDKVKDA